MTRLVEKAFEEASNLPEEDQDTPADMLLNDLASEERGTEAFAKSQNELSLLAKEALTEFKQGKTNQYKRTVTSHTTERFRKAFQ
jgi:hypothetical protein